MVEACIISDAFITHHLNLINYLRQPNDYSGARLVYWSGQPTSPRSIHCEGPGKEAFERSLMQIQVQVWRDMHIKIQISWSCSHPRSLTLTLQLGSIISSLAAIRAWQPWSRGTETFREVFFLQESLSRNLVFMYFPNGTLCTHHTEHYAADPSYQAVRLFWQPCSSTAAQTAACKFTRKQ